MSSWVQLLLLAALSAAGLRPGSAEGDPLPASLVDLVRNSPISSMEDLKLLLQQEANAIEEEEDDHDILTHHSRGRFTRSLVEPPEAMLAACKVRTEVMEVTRSMLDRRNANFILWPTCVEVQRCSGCCNSRLFQCVPTITSSRYLQVMKIQYINKKPDYERVIISVEDHLNCTCRSAPSSPSSSLPVTRPVVQGNLSPPQPPLSPHLPRTVHPAPPSNTHASKANLHRHDDLKHNQQRYHPEEREPAVQTWPRGGYTQLVHWTPPRVQQTPVGHQPIAGVRGSVGSWPSDAGVEHGVTGRPQPLGHESREEGRVHITNGGSEVHNPDHTQRQQQQYVYHHHPHVPQQFSYGVTEDHDLRTQYRFNAPQSDSSTPAGSLTQNFKPEPYPTHPPTTSMRDSVTGQKNTEVTTHPQTATEAVSQKGVSERDESGSANSGDSAGVELTSQGGGIDSKLTIENGHLTEEERRQTLLERTQGPPSTQTHPHLQQRPKPTTFKTEAQSSVAPASVRQVPFRPVLHRRRRKHRKRISKAALRAMIM